MKASVLRFNRFYIGALSAAWIFLFLFPIALFMSGFDSGVVWICIVFSILFGGSNSFEKTSGMVSSYDEEGLSFEIYGFEMKCRYGEILKIRKFSIPPIWIIFKKSFGILIIPAGCLLKNREVLVGLERELERIERD